MRRILICGASSGLGLGLAKGLAEPGDELWLTSRTAPACIDRADGVNRRWVSADLATPDGVDNLCVALGGERLDGIIFTSGTWESNSDLTKVETTEIYEILSVNTASFIALCRGLQENLAQSDNARIVAIGSTAGLENATGSRAAYAASKFGLRGAVHALREFFRGLPLGITVLSPGGLASDIDVDEGIQVARDRYKDHRIPTGDIIAIIRMLFALSPATTVKEMDVPSRMDTDV